MSQKKSFLKKLFNGEISLFIVFWFWFIFISIFIETLFSISSAENNFYKEFFLYSIVLLYSGLIFVIIYKSANKYKGSKVWSFFAKVLVTINLFFSLTFFNDIVKSNFFEDYAIEKEIEEFKSNLPIQVDSSSVLIDINKNNKTIFYNYQLFQVYLETDADRNRFRKQIQNSLCEDTSNLNLLKKDYVLEYEYINEKEEKIIKVQTRKEDCGESIYDLEILNEILQSQRML